MSAMDLSDEDYSEQPTVISNTPECDEVNVHMIDRVCGFMYTILCAIYPV